MVYALMGYMHAVIERRAQVIRRLAGEERGQGTVEYVGLILLVSLLMVGMVAAMKGFNRPFKKPRYLSQSQWPSLSRPSVLNRPIDLLPLSYVQPTI